MRQIRIILALLALVSAQHASAAACVNRFVVRTEQARQIVTLLTGKLTFQEAQALAASIQKKEAPPIEWVKEDGKSVAKQIGDLKVIRPMPVGCDGKTSGVVVVATFLSTGAPAKKMHIRFTPDTTVEFEEQAQ